MRLATLINAVLALLTELGLLAAAGFRVLDVTPVAATADGRFAWPWWLLGVRAYGYLLSAERPRVRS